MPWPKGQPFSEETKAKLREAAKHKPPRPPKSAETRAKHSLALKNSEAHKRHLAQLAESRRGKPRKPFADPVAHSAAISAALRGKPRNVQRRIRFDGPPVPVHLGLPEFAGCAPRDGSDVRGVAAVYAIVNTANGKVYVGSTRNLERRWFVHRYALNRGRHNAVFQADWNTYGPDVFVVRLLRVTDDPAQLIAAEEFWLDRLGAMNADRGYNVCPHAGDSTGYKATPEAKAKRADAARGRHHSAESRMKIGLGNRGKTISEAHRLAVSLAQRGSNSAVAKLTELDIPIIRARIAHGEKDAAIASDYGVSHAAIYGIRKGLAWRHVPDTLS